MYLSEGVVDFPMNVDHSYTTIVGSTTGRGGKGSRGVESHKTGIFQSGRNEWYLLEFFIQHFVLSTHVVAVVHGVNAQRRLSWPSPMIQFSSCESTVFLPFEKYIALDVYIYYRSKIVLMPTNCGLYMTSIHIADHVYV